MNQGVHKVNRQSRTALTCAAAALAAAIIISPGAAAGQGQRGAAPAGSETPPTSPVTGSAANGKSLYLVYTCYGCHGYNGETGRAFVGNWSANLATEDSFIRFLRGRADVAPATPATRMPNFAENTMTDKQAKDIYAYIRTFKSHAPEVKDVPALNAIVKSASQPYKP
jgi:mono/diheme cytochrome c family protein